MSKTTNQLENRIRELLENYGPEFNNEDWEKMKEKMDSLEKSTSLKSPKTISKIYFIARYAAIILLGVLLFYLYNQINIQIPIISVNSANEKINILLPDSTHVWLNKASRLSYPKEFKGDSREVALEGEAYFEVVKDTIRRFIVNTPKSTIIVVGTAFNVKAPLKELCEIISVTEGKVKVTSKQSNTDIFITKGEQSVVYKKDSQITKASITDINYLSWKTNIIEFTNTPLPQVVRTLNAYYNKEIILNDDSLNKVNLTAKFYNESLNDVLNVIVLTLDVDVVTNEGDTIRLKVKNE